MDKIWTFNLVYIYDIRHTLTGLFAIRHTHLTYNVFSFYTIMAYGMLYLHIIEPAAHPPAGGTVEGMYHNNRHNVYTLYNNRHIHTEYAQ
jgi:hypothetical protein